MMSEDPYVSREVLVHDGELSHIVVRHFTDGAWAVSVAAVLERCGRIAPHLVLYESVYLEDPRPRRAIEAIVDWVDGGATEWDDVEAALLDAADAADEASETEWEDPADRTVILAGHVADAAADVVDHTFTVEMALHAVDQLLSGTS